MFAANIHYVFYASDHRFLASGNTVILDSPCS